METPDRIKKSLRIHSLPHPSGCIGCAYRGDNPTKIPNNCANKLFKDVREYIKQLEARVPRWISVEERLPDERKRDDTEVSSSDLVIVAVSDDMDNMFISDDILCDGEWANYPEPLFKITHWMPLPTPPKECSE